MVPYSNGELAQMEQAGRNAERCVCCGAVIPEGRQVCLICELNVKNKCNLVEVVRCKNCEYCQEIDPYESWCTGFGYPARMVTPTDFCSHGERRKDNE